MLIQKNGNLHFCADYRKLDDVTQDRLLLPRTDSTLDTLTTVKWFSTLDMNGYWQVALHPDNKQNTAFSTYQGLWKFTDKPFSLYHTPATLEQLNESILLGPIYEACLVYLVNVIIIGQTFQEQDGNKRNKT
jgi:hypothetical protein